jgi:hypothetical protein
MTYTTMDSGRRDGSIVGAAIWMVVLSILLFWLPVVGPLIAGFVGGRKAGGVGAALTAAALPAIVLAAVVLLITTLVGLPIVGAVAGVGIVIAMIVHSVPLFIGALLGAVL